MKRRNVLGLLRCAIGSGLSSTAPPPVQRSPSIVLGITSKRFYVTLCTWKSTASGSFP